MHRYAPTSPSAFNHKKKPLLPGCDRHPSRSLARGAQQQPSPPHSGRGHSTAYTHRHFPLPSLVQDCSDGPLALAQAPNPHMPQCVSLRLWAQITPPLRSSTFWPRRRPTSHGLPPRHLTAHIARRHCLAFASYRTYFIARHRHRPTETLLLVTCAFPSAEVPAPQIPTAPVELCIPTHPKLQRGHRPNDGRNTRFQRARIALFSNSALDRPSCSSQNTSLFSLREYLSWRYKISQQHRGPRRHFPFVNSNRTSYLRFPQQRRALCTSSASHS